MGLGFCCDATRCHRDEVHQICVPGLLTHMAFWILESLASAGIGVQLRNGFCYQISSLFLSPFCFSLSLYIVISSKVSLFFRKGSISASLKWNRARVGHRASSLTDIVCMIWFSLLFLFEMIYLAHSVKYYLQKYLVLITYMGVHSYNSTTNLSECSLHLISYCHPICSIQS